MTKRDTKTLAETFSSQPPKDPVDAVVQIAGSLDGVAAAVEKSSTRSTNNLRACMALVVVAGLANLWSSRDSSEGVDERAAQVFEAVQAVAEIQAAQTEAHAADVEADADRAESELVAAEHRDGPAAPAKMYEAAKRDEALRAARKAKAVAKKAKARIVAVKPDAELLKKIEATPEPEPAPSAAPKDAEK